MTDQDVHSIAPSSYYSCHQPAPSSIMFCTDSCNNSVIYIYILFFFPVRSGRKQAENGPKWLNNSAEISYRQASKQEFCWWLKRSLFLKRHNKDNIFPLNDSVQINFSTSRSRDFYKLHASNTHTHNQTGPRRWSENLSINKDSQTSIMK